MNLKQLFKRPINAVPTGVAVFVLIVALLGFADATYLSVEHYQNVIPPCSITGGCETVLTSAYSTMFGVPDSFVGAAYYLLILIGIASYLESKKTRLLKYALMLTVVGFVMSLWFVYLQAFVLHAYCAYCLGSALTSTVLFVAAVYLLKKYTEKSESSPENK